MPKMYDFTRWPVSLARLHPRLAARKKPPEIEARLFARHNPLTRRDEWFFPIRGAVAGPYESRKIAKRILAEFIAFQKASHTSNRFS
jgi:hypothetical protein